MFSSIIQTGTKLGRTIGFPTINLDPAVFPSDKEPGVYACWVNFAGDGASDRADKHTTGSLRPEEDSKKHLGALYFGPRLVKNETQNVLEIFILDFSTDVYGKTAQIALGNFIRPPKDFDNLAALTSQIATDINQIRKLGT